MRTTFLYLMLLLGVMCSAQKISSTIVDTEERFINIRIKLDEHNDCSVRVVASILTNMNYYKAYQLTAKYGREHNTGMVAARLVDIAKNEYPSRYIGLLKLDNLSTRKFIKSFAKVGESYIMITQDHTYGIKYSEGLDRWVVYGSQGDTSKTNIAVIKLYDTTGHTK